MLHKTNLVAKQSQGTMDIQFIVGVQKKITVELSKLKFKIKRLRSEMNSLYHIARCYHEFSKHMQTLRVVIRPNQSNICASTSQKAATWLCLVLRRKM